jgi:hypothetical protein
VLAESLARDVEREADALRLFATVRDV